LGSAKRHAGIVHNARHLPRWERRLLAAGVQRPSPPSARRYREPFHYHLFCSRLCSRSGSVYRDRGQEPNTHHFPTPPETMDPENRNVQSPTGPRRNIDLVQVQREADDLARTAQTIPSDVAKQIERLSKHLRAQLNP
jgi:hypothetical protein